MSKLSKYNITVSNNICRKCNKVMQRRAHIKYPLKWHYTQWDWCPQCKSIYMYEEFKCADWKEHERQMNFIQNI